MNLVVAHIDGDWDEEVGPGPSPDKEIWPALTSGSEFIDAVVIPRDSFVRFKRVVSRNDNDAEFWILGPLGSLTDRQLREVKSECFGGPHLGVFLRMMPSLAAQLSMLWRGREPTRSEDLADAIWLPSAEAEKIRAIAEETANEKLLLGFSDGGYDPFWIGSARAIDSFLQLRAARSPR